MKITKSKIIKAPLILLILGIVILILSFVNILSQRRDIKLSNDTLEKISKIDWNNREKLEQIGFCEYEELYYEYVYNDYGYRLYVSKIDEIPTDLKKFKNIYIEATETGSGFLSLYRIKNEEDIVTRRYTIYIDDIKITMLEDNCRDEPLIFEKTIKAIHKKYSTS